MMTEMAKEEDNQTPVSEKFTYVFHDFSQSFHDFNLIYGAVLSALRTLMWRSRTSIPSESWPLRHSVSDMIPMINTSLQVLFKFSRIYK
jgi:hypothetical protein